MCGVQAGSAVALWLEQGAAQQVQPSSSCLIIIPCTLHSRATAAVVRDANGLLPVRFWGSFRVAGMGDLVPEIAHIAVR